MIIERHMATISNSNSVFKIIFVYLQHHYLITFTTWITITYYLSNNTTEILGKINELKR